MKGKKSNRQPPNKSKKNDHTKRNRAEVAEELNDETANAIEQEDCSAETTSSDDESKVEVELDARRIAGPSSAATAGLGETSPWPGFPHSSYDDTIERLARRGSKDVRKSLEAASTASVKKPEHNSHVYYAADHNRRGKQRHSTSQDFYQRGKNHVYSVLPPSQNPVENP